MKLIFETKKQEHDLTGAFGKMAKFRIFSTGRYSNMAIQTTSRQRYAMRIFNKQTQLDTQCISHCVEHCLKPSSLIVHFKVPFIEVKCTIIHITSGVVTFISK